MRPRRAEGGTNNNHRRVQPSERDSSSQTPALMSNNSNNYEYFSQLYQNNGQQDNDRMGLGPPQLIRTTNARRHYPQQGTASFLQGTVEENLSGYSAPRRKPARRSLPARSLPAYSFPNNSFRDQRSNSRPVSPRRSYEGDDISTQYEASLMYGNSEDHTKQEWPINHQTEIPEQMKKDTAMQNLPLAGAQTYIFNDGNNTGSAQDILATCLALGAKHAFNISDATHALWCGGPINQRINYQEIETCHRYDVPIVDAAPWLGRISGLYPGQHWSEIDVSEYSMNWSQKMPAPSQISQLPEETRSSRRNSPLNHSFSEFSSKKEEEDLRLAMELSMEGVKPPPCRISRLSSQPKSFRRKDNFLNHSISEHLDETHQQQFSQEDKDLKLAMELSMLDLALVVKPQHKRTISLSANDPPFKILGIDENATVEETRMAYKKLARLTHPDKGGKPGEFEIVARAYRHMLEKRQQHSSQSGKLFAKDDYHSNNESKYLVKNTAHWDMEIQDHWNLVQSLFQTHGSSIRDNLNNQVDALKQLKLQKKEVGGINHDENDRIIRNSCFYLSLASSYLHGLGAYIASQDELDDEINLDAAADHALTGETALQLKRMIEAAVLNAHPEWTAKGMVGEEVQAFSDFIVYSLDSPTSILADWAVVIFDTVSGFVDIYKGKNYKEYSGGQRNSENTITIQFVSGDHYQALLPARGKSRPSLAEIMSILDYTQVYYVVTDGASST